MNKISMPFQVSWDITTGCNLRCKHCFYSKNQLSNNFYISKDEAMKFVNYLGDNKVFHLSVAGGEPLICDYLPEIIKQAKKNNISTSISTNAILLSKELSNQLKINGLNSIQISLDSINESNNDFIRGNGSFKKTLQGIQNAVDVGLKVVLAIVICKPNLDDWDDIFSFALSQKCYGIKVQTFISDRGIGLLNKNEIEPSYDDVVNLLNKLWFEKAKYEKVLNIVMPLTPQISSILENKKINGCLGCSPGLKSVSISANGDVKACSTQVADEEGVIGNIFNSPLKEIYSKHTDEIEKYKLNNLNLGNSSTSCGSLCGNGCRSTNLNFIKL